MRFTRLVVSAVLTGAAALTLTQTADAFDTSKLSMRGRAIYIAPADKSSGGVLPSDVIDVESKWAPDIDFEYALAPHWGLELLLTIPQRHDVTLKTNGAKLGTVDHLPPTLTAKYYFATNTVRPYLGAGLNFTYFTDDNLPGFDISKTSFGPALQGGFDVSLNDRWSLSVDAKKIWIDTDVKLAGTNTKVTTVNVDPWLYGVGVGYRFGK